MDYEQTIDTAADATQAWATLAAVQTCPHWTASMTVIESLDGPDLRGLLAGLVAALTAGKTRRYLALEAAGLTAAAEAASVGGQ